MYFTKHVKGTRLTGYGLIFYLNPKEKECALKLTSESSIEEQLFVQVFQEKCHVIFVNRI